VLLWGEVGIGKSRSRRRCWNALRMSRIRACATFAPHSTPTAHSIRSSARWNVLLGCCVTTQLDKVDALLAQSFTEVQDAALFAEMLSLRNDGRYPAVELTGQQLRQKTFEALTAQVEGLSRSSPVLMIFEDAHWIDPTSLEALGRTVDRISTLGVLLIVTYRPERSEMSISIGEQTASGVLAAALAIAFSRRRLRHKSPPSFVKLDHLVDAFMAQLDALFA
jgi:hypothetical protein